WSRDELDRFLRGEPPDRIDVDRPGAPPDGEAHGQGQVDQAVEMLDRADARSRRLEAEGRRSSGARPSSGSDDGAHEGDQTRLAGGGSGDRVQMARRRAGPRTSGCRLGAASEAALRRLRELAAEAKNRD